MYGEAIFRIDAGTTASYQLSVHNMLSSV